MKRFCIHKQSHTTTNLGFHKDNYQIVTVFDLAERLEAAKENEEISFFIDDMTKLFPWEQPQNRHYITKNTRFGCDSIMAGQDGGHIKMQTVTDLIPPERGTISVVDYAKFISQYLLPFNARRVIINVQ